MRIGIDCRMWNESGIGRYIRNLVRCLEEDTQNEYVLFLLDNEFESLTFNKNFTKVRANFRWYGLTEQGLFPRIIERQNIELMHFPHFNVPIFYQGEYVVTIHDLIHRKFAMQRASTLGPIMFGVKQLSYKMIFRKAVNNAQKIITVSEYVKKDLQQIYKLSSSKIVVTKEGVDKEFRDLVKSLTTNECQKIIQEKGINGEYIFYVGNAHPHKNLEGLIRAFEKVQAQNLNIKLVLAGKDNYFWARLKQNSTVKNVYFVGYLDDRELAAFYKMAHIYVMPSFEEGFGIPILEAFAAGVPVISSNKASLPEVGGDACLYFDPQVAGDLEKKINELLDDKSLQERLIKKSKEKLKEFSWKKMAEETLKVYKSV